MTVAASRAVLDARELVPFQAAVAAGARVAMSAHVALPARDRIAADLPATLSRAVMTDLLRGELGFDGVSITDALDMAGARPGRGPGTPDVVAAIRAGVDLLLTAADPAARERDRGGAGRRGERAGCSTPTSWPPRNGGLPRSGRGSPSFGDAPDIDVVGGAGHRTWPPSLPRGR